MVYSLFNLNDKPKGNDMKLTALNALEIAKTGNFDAAWEVAQQDEGLLPEVTRAQWVSWAKKVI